jgi:hypothetical protein
MNWIQGKHNKGLGGSLTVTNKAGKIVFVLVWDFVYWDNIFGVFFQPNDGFDNFCDFVLGVSAIQIRFRFPWFKSLQ